MQMEMRTRGDGILTGDPRMYVESYYDVKSDSVADPNDLDVDVDVDGEDNDKESQLIKEDSSNLNQLCEVGHYGKDSPELESIAIDYTLPGMDDETINYVVDEGDTDEVPHIINSTDEENFNNFPDIQPLQDDEEDFDDEEEDNDVAIDYSNSATAIHSKTTDSKNDHVESQDQEIVIHPIPVRLQNDQEQNQEQNQGQNQDHIEPDLFSEDDDDAEIHIRDGLPLSVSSYSSDEDCDESDFEEELKQIARNYEAEQKSIAKTRAVIARATAARKAAAALLIGLGRSDRDDDDDEDDHEEEINQYLRNNPIVQINKPEPYRPKDKEIREEVASEETETDSEGENLCQIRNYNGNRKRNRKPELQTLDTVGPSGGLEQCQFPPYRTNFNGAISGGQRVNCNNTDSLDTFNHYLQQPRFHEPSHSDHDKHLDQYNPFGVGRDTEQNPRSPSISAMFPTTTSFLNQTGKCMFNQLLILNQN